MFFHLSKLLGPMESPADALLSALVIGVILSWFIRTRRIGISITTIVTLMLLSIAIFPVAGWVTTTLEDRFPRPLSLPSHVDGLIVLGGAVQPTTTAGRHIPTLNFDAEKMTEFVRLAKLYPEAQLVFSGGGAELNPDTNLTEADVARMFFREQGLDVGRITFESRSRNTYENVLFSKTIVKPNEAATWLLIQAARDVPRTMGVFHKLGWPVIPVPVAYQTAGNVGKFRVSYDLFHKLFLLEYSSHEWLGLLAYRLTGKTDALFPKPGEL